MDEMRESHRIFLIRHGETDWNKAFRYQGCSDIELNADGAEQARRAGIRLSRIAPARVLASPLLRAYRTAELIMEQNESCAPIEPNNMLREISFGIWEGLTVPEIKEIDGETFERWRFAPFSCAPKGGENFSEIAGRAEVLAAELRERGAPGEDTFVVAHGGVLRSLIAALLQFRDIDLLWRMRFDNCSISVVDLWNVRPSLLISNDTHHLRMERDDDIAALAFPW